MIVAIDTNCILPGKVGGIENYVLGLVAALKAHAPSVSRLVLVTRLENRDLFEPFADDRCEVMLVERPHYQGKRVADWAALSAQDAQAGARLLAEYQRTKVAMIHERGANVVHFPGNAINPLDIDLPAVLNLHDLQHRYFPQYFTPAELANRDQWWAAAARRADALIATTECVAGDLQRHLRVDPSRIIVTHPPVDSTFRRWPTSGELRDVRDRFALAQTTFLYPAAVWPHKNHERLIRAFVTAGIPESQLVLTGGGQDGSTLPELTRDLGAESTVRFLGRVSADELLCLYHLATATIVPSEFEASSYPVMEAMACGCPVASSNVTALPELVGDAGLLFDPHDEDAMADAMRQLATDDELWCALSAAGRRRVREFTAERFAEGVVTAYRAAISSREQRQAA
ncbi:MAG: glycosyltransferase family 1 protein [Tepidisphaeraceae bacterium]